jgi:hypothetical protein
MNLNNISLNLYSFGYYAGFIKDSGRAQEILGIDGLVQLVKKHGLGGVEIPLDHFYPIEKIELGIEKIEKIRSDNLSVFIDLEKIDVDYITRLLPYLPSLGISAVRIKMDQIGKTIYGGNRYDSVTFNSAVNEFKQKLVSLLPVLERHGVALAIENHQDFHSTELVEISRNISEELIGVTWDIGNSISVADSPDSFYNTAAHIIKNVHLKDYKIYKSKAGIRLVRCPLGDGYVDYQDVLKKLDVNDGIVNMSIELGAQITRECDINNRHYWQNFSNVLIDKNSYLDFVDQHAINHHDSLSKYEHGLTEEGMIESELQDIDRSVNNLKQLLGVSCE